MDRKLGNEMVQLQEQGLMEGEAERRKQQLLLSHWLSVISFDMRV